MVFVTQAGKLTTNTIKRIPFTHQRSEVSLAFLQNKVLAIITMGNIHNKLKVTKADISINYK